MFSKILLYSLVVLSISAAQAEEVDFESGEWGVKCEENAFDDLASKKCLMISISLKTDRQLLIIERREFTNEIIVVLTERMPNEMSMDIVRALFLMVPKVNLRVDRETIFTDVADASARNPQVVQLEVRLYDKKTKQLIEEMKNGEKLNIMSEVNGQKFTDTYSLSGFNEAYDFFLKEEK